MTYHVLARKWRPQTFSDLVGQAHVVKALTFALSHNQVHHAYLLTGTRGVGKTSIARIFAKSLNCEINGISANPCGECESCREITSGKFVDLIEVDAASRTGVDETRELIESVSYLPTKGRFKVYLIDEVHMFSKSSFNALLKTLEEPPEYVKFILATTDPEKLPITILSRCLQFNLKSLTQKQICQHLMNICEAESIAYDEQALQLLADAGDGSMRDTLSMTDQAIAYGQGELSLLAVTEILGTIQPTDIEAILFAIATNNPNQLSTALHRLGNYEVDARAFLIEIMKRLQRMAWAKEGIAEQLSPALLSTVGDIPKPLLHLWYDIAEKALPNLSVSGNPREAVEMTLLRMLAFVPNDWLPRHRTALDESLQSQEDTAEKITLKPVGKEKQPSVKEQGNTDSKPVKQVQEKPLEQAVEKTVDKTDNPDGLPLSHVHASPVVSADDLAQAEENFSQNYSNVTDTHTDKTLATVEKAIEEPIKKSGQPIDSNIQNSWQLSEESTDEPPPSSEEINAVMKRGRDIVKPMAKQETVAVDKKPQENTDELTDIDDTDDVNNPPWQFTLADTDKHSGEPVSVTDNTDNTSDNAKRHIASTDKEVSTPIIDIDADKSAALSEENQSSSSVDLSVFKWEKVIYQLGLSDYTLQFASLGILRVEPRDETILATLDLLPKNEVMVTDESLAELQTALQNYFQQNVKVKINLTQLEQATPSEIQQQQQVKQQSDMLEDFRQEPIVQKVLQTFDGQIIEKTLKRTQ